MARKALATLAAAAALTLVAATGLYAQDDATRAAPGAVDQQGMMGQGGMMTMMVQMSEMMTACTNMMQAVDPGHAPDDATPPSEQRG